MEYARYASGFFKMNEAGFIQADSFSEEQPHIAVKEGPTNKAGWACFAPDIKGYSLKLIDTHPTPPAGLLR